MMSLNSIVFSVFGILILCGLLFAPSFAQYMGNVDKESNKTGKNTLEEALKLQRTKIDKKSVADPEHESISSSQSSSISDITCGIGTIEKDGICVPDSSKQIQNIKTTLNDDISKIITTSDRGDDFYTKFLTPEKSQKYKKFIQSIIDSHKINTNYNYESFKNDPFGFIDRTALTDEEYVIYVEWMNDSLTYLKQLFKTKISQIDAVEKQTISKINSLSISNEEKSKEIDQIRQAIQQRKSSFVTLSAGVIQLMEEKVEIENKRLQARNELLGHKSSPIPSVGNSGCLIATATYGSELAPQVQLLREVRDGVLYNTGTGTTFMTGFNEFYYAFSPTIADLERQSPLFKEIIKTTITPMLSTLSILNYVDIDSESEMLGYGIGIILLNAGIYFVLPTFVILKFKHKIVKS